METDLLTCSRDVLSLQAFSVLEQAEFALNEFSSVRYESKAAEAQSWRQTWRERGADLNLLLVPDITEPGLTLHELTWLVWAHLELLSTDASRAAPSRDDALILHARVRMITREFNDFGRDYLTQLRQLEQQCVRAAVFGPEPDPPLPPDATKGTHLDEAKGLYTIRADQSIDFESAYRDHRLPEVRGKHSFYLPKRWDPIVFVSGCSRLFYWSLLAASLVGDAVRVVRPLKDYLAIGALTAMLRSRSSLQTTNETDRVATKLFYEFRLPLGALSAMERTAKVGVNAFAAIGKDCGNNHVRSLTELITIEAAVAFEKADHAMHDAWLWTIWSRVLAACDVDWFADHFCLPHELQTKKKQLETCVLWRTRTRRPIVIWLLGNYFVQAVCEDEQGHEMFRCEDALHALALWCNLLRERYNSESVHRHSLKVVLEQICSFPAD